MESSDESSDGAAVEPLVEPAGATAGESEKTGMIPAPAPAPPARAGGGSAGVGGTGVAAEAEEVRRAGDSGTAAGPSETAPWGCRGSSEVLRAARQHASVPPRGNRRRRAEDRRRIGKDRRRIGKDRRRTGKDSGLRGAVGRARRRRRGGGAAPRLALGARRCHPGLERSTFATSDGRLSVGGAAAPAGATRSARAPSGCGSGAVALRAKS